MKGKQIMAYMAYASFSSERFVNNKNKLGVVVYVFNLNTQKAEAGTSLGIQDQLGLHSESHAIQSCAVF